MGSIDFSPSQLRKNIIALATSGNAGHIGCSFSLVEILSTLYSKILAFDQRDPWSEKRDILVLSKGHGAMALYSIFLQLGWIGQDDVDKYFSSGSRLFGLMESGLPSVDFSTGSLGHGLAMACGMAFGLRRKKDNNQVYCILGDGEINEGSVWEAALFAGHHKLSNLNLIIDYNKFQAMGKVKDIIDLDPLDKKFESFNFKVFSSDGHSLADLEKNLRLAQEEKEKPSVVIAHTIKGAGVSFMENNNLWHYSRLTPELKEKALAEISSSNPRIRS